MEPIACEAIVYRAMSRKDWIDPKTQCVLSLAFVRRPPPKDNDGLSVDVDSPRSCASVLSKCHGVASLHVGRIRVLGVDVVVDEAPHANITGVPRKADDLAKAEWLAGQLAKQARLIPPDQYATQAN